MVQFRKLQQKLFRITKYSNQVCFGSHTQRITCFRVLATTFRNSTIFRHQQQSCLFDVSLFQQGTCEIFCSLARQMYSLGIVAIELFGSTKVSNEKEKIMSRIHQINPQAVSVNIITTNLLPLLRSDSEVSMIGLVCRTFA